MPSAFRLIDKFSELSDIGSLTSGQPIAWSGTEVITADLSGFAQLNGATFTGDITAPSLLFSSGGSLTCDGTTVSFNHNGGGYLSIQSGKLTTSDTIFCNNGVDPSIANQNYGVGITIQAAGGDDYGQLRIVSNSGWADEIQTAYFQIKTGSNNAATFMGGQGGNDLILDRLQFCSTYTQITDGGFTITPVPYSNLGIVNTTDKIGLSILGSNGQTDSFIELNAYGPINIVKIGIDGAYSIADSTGVAYFAKATSEIALGNDDSSGDIVYEDGENIDLGFDTNPVYLDTEDDNGILTETGLDLGMDLPPTDGFEIISETITPYNDGYGVLHLNSIILHGTYSTIYGAGGWLQWNEDFLGFYDNSGLLTYFDEEGVHTNGAYYGDGSHLTGITAGVPDGSNGDLQFKNGVDFYGGGPNWNGFLLNISGIVSLSNGDDIRFNGSSDANWRIGITGAFATSIVGRETSLQTVCGIGTGGPDGIAFGQCQDGGYSIMELRGYDGAVFFRTSIVDGTGTNATIEPNNRCLDDENGTHTVIWSSEGAGGSVLRTGGNTVVDWGNQYLKNTSGATILDWSGSNAYIGGNIDMSSTGAIVFPGTGGDSYVRTGTFGNPSGVSLVCANAYELNWAGGVLSNSVSASYIPLRLVSTLQMEPTARSNNTRMAYFKQHDNDYGFSFNLDDNTTGHMFMTGVNSGTESTMLTFNRSDLSLASAEIPAVAATGVMSIDGSPSDGQTIEINDGNGQNITFTYRNSPSLTNEFNFDIGSTFFANVFNASGIGINAYYDGNVTIAFTNNVLGTSGNIDIINGLSNIPTTGMSGGLSAYYNWQLNQDGSANFASLATFEVGIAGVANWQINADGSISLADDNFTISAGGNMYIAGTSMLDDGNITTDGSGNIITVGITADSATLGSSSVNSDGPSSVSLTIQAKNQTVVIALKEVSSNVATLATTDGTFSIGDVVIVAGVDSTFNGTHTVTGVPSGNSFTYALITGDVGYTSCSGSATLNQFANITDWKDGYGNIVASIGPNGELFAGQISQNTQVLTDASTIAWDANAGTIASVTLGATGRTLTILNALAGSTMILKIVQDSGGSRTITTYTNFKWPNATPPTLSTDSGDVDLLTAVTYDGTNFYGILQNNFG